MKFTGYQADNYCKANGGRAVSLDSNEASEHFLDVSAQFAQRYYWTGGRLNHPCKTLYWPSGRSEGWEAGQRYWSPNVRETPRCPNAAPNHFWNGKKYILTFLLKDEGCKKFTGYQADNYCKANGGRAVSLDSNEASEHFLDVSAQFAQPDNRNHDQDGAEDEICLAVLNNFYNDNIKWHDVACHHKKPTICELP